MRSLNNYIKCLYGIIICSLFFKLLNDFKIIDMPNMVLSIVWLLIFIYGFIITRDDYNSYGNVSDKVETMIIIVIGYLILYSLLGLFTGYNYNVNNYGLIEGLACFILPIFFEEYIRGILCNYSGKSKYIKVFITILYILLNISFSYSLSIKSGEAFFKFLCLQVIPVIGMEIVLTNITYEYSYKVSLVYKVIYGLYITFIPIVPDIHFFIKGIIFLVPIGIIYSIMLDNNEYSDKTTIIEYIPICVIVMIFVFNYFGLLKYRSVAILSNSMYPTYVKGDAVIIEKLNDNSRSKLKVGDIVSYYDKNNNLVIHRIKRIINGEYVITQGDFNKVSDKRIEIKDVVGKYMFHIKYIGYPTVMINEVLKK